MKQNFLVAALAAVLVFAGGRAQEETAERLPGAAKMIPLTPEEQAWIAANPVRVGTYDFPPYAMVGRDGHPVGHEIDMLRLIARRTGLRFEFHVYPDFPSVMAALKAGQVDIVHNLLVTPEREQFLSFTRPYGQSFSVIVTRTDTPYVMNLRDLNGMRVGTLAGSAHNLAMRAAAPDCHLVEFATLAESLKSLAGGKVDAAYSPVATAAYLIKTLQLSNLRLGSVVGTQLELRLGVRKALPILASVADRAVADITPAEHKVLDDRWLDLDQAPDSRVKWLYWLLIAAAALGVVAIASAADKRRLKRLVEERSRQLIAAEEEKRETVEKISENLPNSTIYQVEHRPDGSQRYLYIGTNVTRLWGVTPEELKANPRAIDDLVFPEDRRILEDAMVNVRSLEPAEIVVRLKRPDGAVRWMRNSFRPRALPGGSIVTDGIQSDITASQKMEEHVRQSEKMTSVGRLSSGIAHDFNNLLTVIVGNVGLIQATPGLDPEVAGSVTEIREAADRAASLTRQLLLFSRQQAMKMTTLDVNAVVTQMSSMLRRLLGEAVTLKLRCAPQPLLAEVDNSMLEQVILNLAVNARDAMDGAGTLAIETSRVNFDEATKDQVPNGRAGSFAVISVTDTGTGIPEDLLPQIFEPFFTTKDIGKGTGLGLATVFGIVKQHQGWVNVYSEMGKGSTFRVYLPVADQRGGAANGALAEQGLPGGGETILLVEDEPAVRKMVRVILTQAGYGVTESVSGREAMKAWSDQARRFNLLLTDMVMPDGVSGKNLADTLRRDAPDLKVIFMTGYSTLLVAGELNDGTLVLQKPFSREKLLGTVRHVLDGDVAV